MRSCIMMVIKALLVLSSSPVVMAFPGLQCCMMSLHNGSVSYTLNHTVPQNWLWTWTKDGVVIVSEHGDTSEDVLGPTENGYILRKHFPSVVCKLESPENGVSMEVPCTDWCPTADPGGTNAQFQLGLIIGLSVIFTFGLFAFGGFLLYRRFSSNRCRDNPTPVEMQDRNLDQNQDLLEDRNNPDHQNTPK